MSQLIVEIYKLSLTLTLVRHNLLHIVLQGNDTKTQSLIILTAIHAKRRPRVEFLSNFFFQNLSFQTRGAAYLRVRLIRRCLRYYMSRVKRTLRISWLKTPIILVFNIIFLQYFEY